MASENKKRYMLSEEQAKESAYTLVLLVPGCWETVQLIYYQALVCFSSSKSLDYLAPGWARTPYRSASVRKSLIHCEAVPTRHRSAKIAPLRVMLQISGGEHPGGVRVNRRVIFARECVNMDDSACLQ